MQGHLSSKTPLHVEQAFKIASTGEGGTEEVLRCALGFLGFLLGCLAASVPHNARICNFAYHVCISLPALPSSSCTALAVPHQHRRGGKATSCQSFQLLLLRVVVCYLLILSCSSRPVASKLCASLQRLPTLAAAAAAAAVAATHMLWFPLALPLDPVPLSVRSLVISVVVLIACSAPVWPGLVGAGLACSGLGALTTKRCGQHDVYRAHASVSQSDSQAVRQSLSQSPESTSLPCPQGQVFILILAWSGPSSLPGSFLLLPIPHFVLGVFFYNLAAIMILYIQCKCHALCSQSWAVLARQAWGHSCRLIAATPRGALHHVHVCVHVHVHILRRFVFNQC